MITDNDMCFFWKLCHTANSLRLSPDMDVIADTYNSTGQIILALALTGESEAEYLVGLTSLPVPFVETVLEYFQGMGMRSIESFLALSGALANNRKDIRQIDDFCRWANDDFWESDLVDDLPLHVYRGQIVVGGVERRYPDNDDAEQLCRRLYEHIERFAALN